MFFEVGVLASWSASEVLQFINELKRAPHVKHNRLMIFLFTFIDVVIHLTQSRIWKEVALEIFNNLIVVDIHSFILMCTKDKRNNLLYFIEKTSVDRRNIFRKYRNYQRYILLEYQNVLNTRTLTSPKRFKRSWKSLWLRDNVKKFKNTELLASLRTWIIGV